ncbi:hypothetical protein XANCAGTX0491_003924 [Xanthoria calcicola]
MWLLLRLFYLQTILGALNPGKVLQTIPAGVVNTFSANTAWQNPFTKTIWIHMADASVALLADHVWPALIPRSTGTGRSPHVINHWNAQEFNEDMVDMSDPLVYKELLRIYNRDPPTG